VFDVTVEVPVARTGGAVDGSVLLGQDAVVVALAPDDSQVRQKVVLGDGVEL